MAVTKIDNSGIDFEEFKMGPPKVINLQESLAAGVPVGERFTTSASYFLHETGKDFFVYIGRYGDKETFKI